MTHTYWNDWHFGWGWFLWFGRMKADIARG